MSAYQTTVGEIRRLFNATKGEVLYLHIVADISHQPVEFMLGDLQKGAFISLQARSDADMTGDTKPIIDRDLLRAIANIMANALHNDPTLTSLRVLVGSTEEEGFSVDVSPTAMMDFLCLWTRIDPPQIDQD